MPTTAKSTSFDLIVIGSGPGGQRAAVQGAKAGKKVAVIESHGAVGGACIHAGTIPSKSFRESVYRWSLGSRGTLGREREHSHAAVKGELPDMARLLRRRDRVVSTESQVVFDQLQRNNITVFNGRAQFASRNEVLVATPKGPVTLKGEFFIIATGAHPVAPAHLANDGKLVHDSDTILTMKKVPKSMAVLGGGIIGCEYASMYSMVGTKVYLIDRRHEILASVDREIVNHLIERFTSQGVELILKTEAVKLERKQKKDSPKGSKDQYVQVHLANGRKLNVDSVLVAQGRYGNTQNLGLEKVGIQPDERGLIKVDQFYRTDVPNIYAVGDVVGSPALASTAMEQGRIACCHAFEIAKHTISENFPYGIYTIPEISMVGATEESLAGSGIDFVVGKAHYRELARGQIVGDHWGLLKMVVDRKTLKILGVHIVGDNAADLIHIGQAVMTLNGDVNYFIHSVFNYPTLAEAYKTAAFHAVNLIKGTTRTR